MPEHKFMCVTAGIRLTEYTYEWAKEYVGRLAETPSEPAVWLELAGKLKREGNYCEHLVRHLWEDGYKMPEGMNGTIYRSDRYFENGQMYDDGAGVTSENGELTTSHYANCGWFKEVITLEKARKILGVRGGKYCPSWGDMSIRIWW